MNEHENNQDADQDNGQNLMTDLEAPNAEEVKGGPVTQSNRLVSFKADTPGQLI